MPKTSDTGSFIWSLRPPGGTYRGTIYTDGSRIDGLDPRTGRNGWAFVVVDEQGRTVARAYGVPPPWIDDIPGAEAWALVQAATVAEPGCRVVSDCQPCVDAVHRGRVWATSDKRKHARVHAMVFEA